MNIKNIIREELNDFDWLDDMPTYYTVSELVDNYDLVKDMTFSTDGSYYPPRIDGTEHISRYDHDHNFNYNKVLLMNINRNYDGGPLLTVKILDDSFRRGHNGTAFNGSPVKGCDGRCWNLTPGNVSVNFTLTTPMVTESEDDMGWMDDITPVPKIDVLEDGTDYVIHLSPNPEINKTQQSVLLNKFDLDYSRSAITHAKDTEVVNGRKVITNDNNGNDHIHTMFIRDHDGERVVGYFNNLDNVNSYCDIFSHDNIEIVN